MKQLKDEAGEAGFSLLEIVIAIAIFALSSAVLLPAIAKSYARTDETLLKERLLWLAESKIREVSIERQQLASPISGEYRGLAWTIRGERYLFEDEVSLRAISGFAYQYEAEVSLASAQNIDIEPVVLSHIVWIDR
jgi:prepilin-type N-terminal cleavage/methylation domain-containing protein